MLNELFPLLTIVLCILRIRYINEDTSIVPMLKMLKDSGRATFLVTNRLVFSLSSFLQFFIIGNKLV